jgi:acyl dehydratase
MTTALGCEEVLGSLQALIGRRGPRVTTPIDASAVSRFAEAVGDFNPLYFDEAFAARSAYGRPVVPPTFLSALPYERPDLPGDAGKYMYNLGNTFDFARLPRIGERITTSATYDSACLRARMILLGMTVRYDGEDGREVAAATVRWIIDPERVCAETLGAGLNARRAGTVDVPAGGWYPRARPAPGRPWPITDLDALHVGSPVPPLSKPPLSVVQFVRYAGATGDFNPIHYDREAAQADGLPDVIAPGLLKMAFFGQHVMSWAGAIGWLRRLTATYRDVDGPGAALTSTGVVRRIGGGEQGAMTVEIDLRLAEQSGAENTVGSAIIEVVRPVVRPALARTA